MKNTFFFKGDSRSFGTFKRLVFCYFPPYLYHFCPQHPERVGACGVFDKVLKGALSRGLVGGFWNVPDCSLIPQQIPSLSPFYKGT